MELYIIRHAQSVNNVLMDQHDRVVDPPLTDLGERQARILAQHIASGWQPITWSPIPVPENVPMQGNWRGYGFTRLYCSPMLRALQTAQLIGRATSLQPEVWIDIHEQGGMYLEEGEGEDRMPIGKPGLSRAEILARFPNYVLPQGITQDGWYSGGYEDWPAAHVRAARVAEALRSWASDDSARIAIVSHGGFADALLKALLHGGPAPLREDNRPGFFYLHFNTAIDRVDFDAQGRLRVAYLNRAEHLPPEMLS
jgi:2,3-bisphosphoglycerate-dependent phosphoglycerate mutase